eukprot:6214372-Pleurochrysis_carterae.AAC.1
MDQGCSHTQPAYNSTPGKRRVSAHFQTSFPWFKSTCSRSIIQRSKPTDVRGIPPAPGCTPRCFRLCADVNAARSFFPAVVSHPALSAVCLSSNASRSACAVRGLCPYVQQSQGRTCPSTGSCARTVRISALAWQSHVAHVSCSAESVATSAGDGTRCIASALQPQIEFSMARTPAKSPVK